MLKFKKQNFLKICEFHFRDCDVNMKSSKTVIKTFIGDINNEFVC